MAYEYKHDDLPNLNINGKDYKTGYSQNNFDDDRVKQLEDAATKLELAEKTVLIIDQLSELDAMTDINKTGVYDLLIRRGGQLLSFGTLAISTDTFSHVINQTIISNLTIKEDGSINGDHKDGGMHIIYRTYNRFSPSMETPRNTWTKWSYIAGYSKVVQETGESTTDVMSQNIVSSMFYNIDQTFALNNKKIELLDGTKLDKTAVVQEKGASATNVISQKIVSYWLKENELEIEAVDYNKLDKTAVKQETGTSTTDVMSQKAVTDEIGGVLKFDGFTEDDVIDGMAPEGRSNFQYFKRSLGKFVFEGMDGSLYTHANIEDQYNNSFGANQNKLFILSADGNLYYSRFGIDLDIITYSNEVGKTNLTMPFDGFIEVEQPTTTSTTLENPKVYFNTWNNKWAFEGANGGYTTDAPDFASEKYYKADDYDRTPRKDKAYMQKGSGLLYTYRRGSLRLVFDLVDETGNNPHFAISQRAATDAIANAIKASLRPLFLSIGATYDSSSDTYTFEGQAYDLNGMAVEYTKFVTRK